MTASGIDSYRIHDRNHTTSAAGARWPCSKPPVPRGCRSCSKGRPAAARPGSWSTWPIVCSGR